MAAITPGGNNRVPGIGIGGNHAQTGRTEGTGAPEQREVVEQGQRNDPALSGGLRNMHRNQATAPTGTVDALAAGVNLESLSGPGNTTALAELAGPKPVNVSVTPFPAGSSHITVGSLRQFVNE
jgi:hypothetical protein